MPPNLPPFLPAGFTAPALHGASGVSLHASDLSVSKLQQKKDVEGAKVSANQVVRGIGYNRTVTSISRLGGANNGPKTSINRPSGQEVDENESMVGEEADDRRYDYMQRMIRVRKIKEAKELEKKSAGSAHDDSFKAGISNNAGKSSFDKRLGRLIRQKRSIYDNISNDDKKIFSGIVKDTLKNKPTGAPVSRLNRLKMKMQIERQRQSRGGILSSDDAKDFKNLVDKLK